MIGTIFLVSLGCHAAEPTVPYSAAEEKVIRRLSTGLATQAMKARREQGFPVLSWRGATVGRVLIVIPGLSDMNAELDVSGGTVERLCLSDLRSQAFTKQNGLVVNAFVRWPSAKWPRQLKFKLRYSNGTGVSGWLPLRFLDDELSWRSYGAVFWTIDLEKVPTRTPPTRFSVVQGSDVKKRAAASGTVVVDRLIVGADARAMIGTRGKLR